MPSSDWKKAATEMSKKALKHYLAETSRILLSFTFLFSGFVKGIDPWGTSIKIGEYLEAFGLGALSSLSMVASIGLSSIEFILGGWILMGFWRKKSAVATTIVMIVMTLLTLHSAIFNTVADCGCFGDAFKLSNWETFGKNIVLLVFAFFFLKGNRYTTPILQKKWMYVFTSVFLLGWAIFIYSNLAHLPMIDFRPFKKGKSLRALVLPPADAPEPIIEYDFIYEKDGKRETFSMHNLPDESWTYVDRVEHLISPGYQPPIEDFSIFRDDEEVTQELLELQGSMIWVLSANWSDASHTAARRLNKLHYWAKESGVRFYGISASVDAEKGAWRNSSGASYPLLFADAVTIKTMVRANPSIMFIKDGVIVEKINANDLPEEEQIASFAKNVFQRDVNSIIPSVYIERWVVLFIWLICSLVFLILQIGKGEDNQNSPLWSNANTQV